ncbi:hypothetical protein BX070DRAFT_219863 [Coemansia spiralis]|nr:hypothetical protein BX070DRAFT_219863 [Coemansia spiralis]
MHSLSIFAAATAALFGTTQAFIRFGCGNYLVEDRVDPIVDPGTVSGHVHKIVGGSGFSWKMDYADARASTCSSCPIKQDLSNYWTPKLYFQNKNGTFVNVPTVGDSAADMNGGMTVYYLQRGPNPANLTAFPEGFRMLAGNPNKRTYDGDFASQAVSFACLGTSNAETNGFPNYNCPGGLRAQIFFPSCWDGVNLDSSDHRSHMAYPATGAYNSGTCPGSHPVQTVSIFYEILYDTNSFANEWWGSSQPFVLSNGDKTGYSFHGDFVNGWDVPTLQKVIDTCQDPNAQGALDKCAVIADSLYTSNEMNSCRLTPQINEQIRGTLKALPGCNPVTSTAAELAAAKANPVCTDTSGIYNPVTTFTDYTSSGWSFLGCATDDGSSRTLTGASTVYTAGAGASMTIEMCASFCETSNFQYFGVEYGSQCFCGNSVAADRIPNTSSNVIGNCRMPCNGNSAEFCGGALALDLYKRCEAGQKCVNAAGYSSGNPATVSPDPGASSTSGASTLIVSSAAATPTLAVSKGMSEAVSGSVSSTASDSEEAASSVSSAVSSSYMTNSASANNSITATAPTTTAEVYSSAPSSQATATASQGVGKCH